MCVAEPYGGTVPLYSTYRTIILHVPHHYTSRTAPLYFTYRTIILHLPHPTMDTEMSNNVFSLVFVDQQPHWYNYCKSNNFIIFPRHLTLHLDSVSPLPDQEYSLELFIENWGEKAISYQGTLPDASAMICMSTCSYS
jgi:hypothetical protein